MTIDAPNPATSWPHLQAVIDNGGSISIGRIDPVACVAMASEGHAMYAALLRRDQESLPELFLKTCTNLCIGFIRTWLTRLHTQLKPLDAQLRRRTCQQDSTHFLVGSEARNLAVI